MTTADRLGEDALACIHAAIAAVEPEGLVREFLEKHPDLLQVPGAIHLAGIGKAGAAMARGAAGVLGERLASGALIVPAGQEARAPEGIETFGGGHPVPNEAGVRGAGRSSRSPNPSPRTTSSSASSPAAAPPS